MPHKPITRGVSVVPLGANGSSCGAQHAAELSQQLILDRFLSTPIGAHRNNDVIISAGDYSTELYYLMEGSVSVQYEDQDGHEIILAYLHEGDFFGEIGMFDERRERSMGARAATQKWRICLTTGCVI